MYDVLGVNIVLIHTITPQVVPVSLVLVVGGRSYCYSCPAGRYQTNYGAYFCTSCPGGWVVGGGVVPPNV